MTMTVTVRMFCVFAGHVQVRPVREKTLTQHRLVHHHACQHACNHDARPGAHSSRGDNGRTWAKAAQTPAHTASYKPASEEGMKCSK